MGSFCLHARRNQLIAAADWRDWMPADALVERLPNLTAAIVEYFGAGRTSDDL